MGLAAALLVAGSRHAGAADDAPILRTPEFTARVKASIQKGVAWLSSAQQKDGSFGDCGDDVLSAALACHALRVCGAPRDDPRAASAYAYVRAAVTKEVADKNLEFLGTPTFSFVCAAIADHGDVSSSVDASGEPSYVLPKADRELLTTLANYVEKFQNGDGTWSLSKCMRDDPGDRSDVAGLYTYNALLGLKTASRCGIKVQPATWDKSLRYFLQKQDPAGTTIPDAPRTKPGAGKPKARGWDLDTPRSSSDWSPFELDTANAVACVAICRSEIINGQKGKPAPDARAELGIGDGLRFLGANEFLLDQARKGADEFAMGFISAIERACDLVGAERLGKIDWYGELADALMKTQEQSGAWYDESAKQKDQRMRRRDAVVATSHALLVLARGTTRVQWTVTAALDDSDINFAVAPTLSEKDFADLLDLVLSRWRRISDAAVKERLFAKATAIGPRIVPQLVKRLASEKDEERAAAFALLKRATGLDHGYAPAATPDARATAVAAWQAWWTANEKTLHFDAATGRLIP